MVRPRAFRRPNARGNGTLTLLGPGDVKLAEWAFPPPPDGEEAPDLRCRDLADREVRLLPPAAFLVIEARGGEIALDRTLLSRH